MLEAIQQQSTVFSAVYAQTGTRSEDAISGVAKSQADEDGQQLAATSKTLPEQKTTGSAGQQKDSVELSKEAEEIHKLQARDREVRAHEAAHAAVGGAYAGSPSYSVQRGPDGQTYAVGGEVSIDVAPISGDPEATLQKEQQVQSAALAPAEPSAQDLKVAQRAQALAAKARMELTQQKSEELKSEPAKGKVASSAGAVSVDSGSGSVRATAQQPNAAPTDSFSGTVSRLNIHV